MDTERMELVSFYKQQITTLEKEKLFFNIQIDSIIDRYKHLVDNAICAPLPLDSTK